MVLGVLDVVEEVPPASIRSDLAIVPLCVCVCVLLQLAFLDVDQSDHGVLSPVLKPATDTFRAAIHPNGQRLTTPSDDLVHTLRNMF